MPFITSHNESTDDQTLIRSYKTTGELKYVGALFEKYMVLIYGVCLRYFAEEPAKDAAMEKCMETLTEEQRRMLF